MPEIRIGHFLSLCDSTGILQHAVHSVPDRAHGYCVDDNARALLLSSALAGSGEAQLPETLTARFAAFVQHAWNPDTRRFRNFMSYDRRWLEDVGSEDSHGRTLWALAECARNDADPSRRRWAAALFKTALPVVEDFSSPRAWAFTLLALDAYCAVVSGDVLANRVRALLADRLMSKFAAKKAQDWLWFEDVLAYDNARLPQALLQTGLSTRTPRYVEVGLRSLRWLMSLQTAPSGCFRPVGTKSFGRLRQRSGGVRSAASRGGGNDFRLPRCGAGGWRRGVAGRGDARVRLVSRRKRPAHDTDRCQDGQLFGWVASGSTQ